MESLRGLVDLQGVNEFFLFAEKWIQRFDESRFQGGEMKWSASSSEDRDTVHTTIPSFHAANRRFVTEMFCTRPSMKDDATRVWYDDTTWLK